MCARACVRVRILGILKIPMETIRTAIIRDEYSSIIFRLAHRSLSTQSRCRAGRLRQTHSIFFAWEKRKEKTFIRVLLLFRIWFLSISPTIMRMHTSAWKIPIIFTFIRNKMTPCRAPIWAHIQSAAPATFKQFIFGQARTHAHGVPPCESSAF